MLLRNLATAALTCAAGLRLARTFLRLLASTIRSASYLVLRLLMLTLMLRVSSMEKCGIRLPDSAY